MRPSFGNARAVLGTAGILLIAGLIGTYPHPDYRLGVTTVLVIAGMFPSLLTIFALVRGGVLAQRVATSLSWFPLCWSIVSLPAALILGLNANTYIVVAAMPLQLVVLPLLVFTRDPLRVAFLQRVVRLGLAGMLVVWLIASWLFAGYVQAAAAIVAEGKPYCLSVSLPGAARGEVVLLRHHDLLLLQRIIAYPARQGLTRYRLQASIPGAAVEQWHFSFRHAAFVPSSGVETKTDCAGGLEPR